MKNNKIFVFTMFLAIIFGGSSFYRGEELIVADKVIQDTTFVYKDGTYDGQSRSSYTSEPYWGRVRVTIKNQSFTNINFTVRDSALHETFNENYEKHFQGNMVYIQQSRNDWKGVQAYPKQLSEKQDISKIDAISGATWSYNIFKASLKEALKRAK